MNGNELIADICIAINILCGMIGISIGMYLYMHGAISIGLVGGIVGSMVTAGNIIAHEVMSELKQFKALAS